MHEMGIANSILDAVRTESSRYPGARPVKVGVRIGEMAAIDADSLRFCFEAMVRDSDLDGLELEVELCARQHICRQCSRQFPVKDYEFECPACGAFCPECVAGDELELAYVEVDEDEPSPVGA
jgi:hydrogenase nickel incorporation protein HypA/HybF